MTTLTNNLNEQLFQELDDKAAANFSGDAAYLYANATFTGRKLTFYKGTANLGWYGYNFNDQTSSIKISPGEKWNFYRDDKHHYKLATLGSGSYTRAELKKRGILDNSITSLERVA